MSDLQMPFDSARLRRFLRLCDVSVSELSRRSGINRGHLNRILAKDTCQDMKLTIASALATSLGCPLDCFVDAPDPWDFLDLTQAGRIHQQFSRTRHCRWIISLSATCDTFLLPDPMLRAIEEERFRRSGFSSEMLHERLDFILDVAEQRRVSREKDTYRMLILCPDSVLKFAAERNRGWLREISRSMEQQAGRTAYGFLSATAWQTVDTFIRLNIRNVPWSKVNVYDDLIVSMWTVYGMYNTFHPRIVEQILRLITGAISTLVPYSFPCHGSEISFEQSYERARAHLRKQWLS